MKDSLELFCFLRIRKIDNGFGLSQEILLDHFDSNNFSRTNAGLMVSDSSSMNSLTALALELAIGLASQAQAQAVKCLLQGWHF